MRSIGLMLVVGTLAAPVSAQQAARTPPPAEMKGQPSPQGFSVVLVLGDLNSGANADGVPAAARKASSAACKPDGWEPSSSGGRSEAA